MIGAGPLMKNDALPYEVNGVKFRKGDPTRREEYHWALEAVRDEYHDRGCQPDCRTVVLDAGCGYDPTIHLFPYMLTTYACPVLAVDANPEHTMMPAAPGIFRMVGDITRPSGAHECVDIWTCISVMEHLPSELREQTLRGAFEILKPGGLLIVTADEIPARALNTWAASAGFEIGPETEGVSDLSPGVSWLAARKP